MHASGEGNERALAIAASSNCKHSRRAAGCRGQRCARDSAPAAGHPMRKALRLASFSREGRQSLSCCAQSLPPLHHAILARRSEGLRAGCKGLVAPQEWKAHFRVYREHGAASSDLPLDGARGGAIATCICRAVTCVWPIRIARVTVRGQHVRSIGAWPRCDCIDDNR